MPSSAPRDLSPAVVYVADRLPHPPETFTAVDVVDVLADLRASETMTPLRFDQDEPADVLAALLAAEWVSVAEAGPPARYLVHPDALPL